MEQKDKDLLLKDLCARLPYGVIVQGIIIYYNKDKDKILYKECDKRLNYQYLNHYESLKPYLRPMSSMTEEEESEYHGLCYPEWNNRGLDGGNWHYHNTISSIDWLNAHHIDYRNLIEKGLAIEAPKNMYKEE